MARTAYTVGPISDSKRWQVLADGRQVSRHNNKQNAIQEARKLADGNDSITVQNRDGQFGRRIRN